MIHSFRRRFRRPALAAVLLVGFSLVPVRADERFPPELVDFVRYGNNPVFTAAGEGTWEVRIRERGWILFDGETYRMWYTGYDGTREGLKMLGYATSTDGIDWKRHPENPIYREHWVEDMMVVEHEGTYYMFAEGLHDRAHLLKSPDGLRWERIGQLDVRNRDGSPIEPGPYGTPTAWHEDGTWYLFYERRDAGIWLATSRDMQVWTNLRDDPVLLPGPAPEDRDLIALNQIIKYQGRYYAYYHGAPAEPVPRTWSTHVAVSEDLIQWTKYPGNPILPVEENKSSGILVHDGDRFRLYTMHDEVHLHLRPADAQKD
jgi:beta-1,2-mannobiose phosphorylase / 1,2-beta-oligomannan phosphorylase